MLAIGITTRNGSLQPNRVMVWSTEAVTFFGVCDYNATVDTLYKAADGVYPEYVIIIENGEHGVPNVIKAGPTPRG